jgi:hypothetical protein
MRTAGLSAERALVRIGGYPEVNSAIIEVYELPKITGQSVQKTYKTLAGMLYSLAAIGF